MQHGAKPLAASTGGAEPASTPEAKGPYLFGRESPCYADFALAHSLTRARAQFPDETKKISSGSEEAAPDGLAALEALESALMARPRLAAYVKSDRRAPFADDSMM